MPPEPFVFSRSGRQLAVRALPLVRLALCCCGWVAACCVICWPEAALGQPSASGQSSPTGQSSKSKVLLLWQSPDGHPPGTHEYQAGMKLLATLLGKTPGIEPVVQCADDPWDEGPEQIREADGLVLFLTEGAKWISAEPRRQQAFQMAAQRGAGMCALHWAMGTKPPEAIAPFVQIFGACHGGPDRRFTVMDAVLTPNGEHPVLTALSPISVQEELYFRLKVGNPEQPILPLMQSEIEGQRETIAWAWERPDGGRSFGFTGLHFHGNWREEGYRRLITQGVLWSLKRPIPEGGADVALPPEAYALPQPEPQPAPG